eukprot:TRINITY_DN6101_c0_g2_i1.p4 TRINITY_DN6101_c0_g2~~TRINITY_DN6101_c0_g2_i1.p4  ORF type:complete len:141 (+),score=23.58 TRINITY_DN6101_c0_g2_i1:1325-1747(+)
MEIYSRMYLSDSSNSNEESDGDSSEAAVDAEDERAAEEVSIQRAIRSRTLGPADFPEPSSFLSPSEVEIFSRMCLSDSSNSNEESDSDSSEQSANAAAVDVVADAATQRVHPTRPRLRATESMTRVGWVYDSASHLRPST